jgi:hypothetical protein
VTSQVDPRSDDLTILHDDGIQDSFRTINIFARTYRGLLPDDNGIMKFARIQHFIEDLRLPSEPATRAIRNGQEGQTSLKCHRKSHYERWTAH